MSLATDTTIELDPIRDRSLLVDLVVGAAAGVIAGALMLATAMVSMARATEMEATLPIKNVAAAWMGVSALIGGPGTLVIGALTHLLVAAIWGSVFGLLSSARLVGAANLAAGMLCGTVAWVMMTHVVMPVANPVMEARVGLLPDWWWFGLHLVFGIALALIIRRSECRFGGSHHHRKPRHGQACPSAGGG